MTEPVTGVIVCGMPRSGNRLVKRLLEHNGVNRFQIYIQHMGSGLDRAVRRGGERVRAIIPLRAEAPHWGSCEAAWFTPETSDDAVRLLPVFDGVRDEGHMQEKHFYPTLRILAVAGVPVLPVSYEQIVEAPEMVGRRIAEFCGIEFAGWGEEIKDGNAKYVETSSAEKG